MKCVLMHKKIPVAYIEINSETGYITKIIELCNPNHLPVGVNEKKGVADRRALNEWWADRSIPASRSGIHEALEVLEISDSKVLLTRCFGLSLSDQYWIKPAKSNVKWENVNFFSNSFSDDIGDILFGNSGKVNNFDFNSPDNTSDGSLKKRWKIINGERYLIKGGSKPFQQQPFNEAIASLICERLNIPHVDYTVIWDKGEPYSACRDFVNAETELVAAWRIIKTKKKDSNTSIYNHYVNCCESLGICNIKNFLDQMIVLDYIIANEDRHFNNFGLIRNAQTLEWIGSAPIFDSGTSLGFDSLTTQIIHNKSFNSKPFKKSHDEQIKLVTSYDWINFENLSGVENDIFEILSTKNSEGFIDDERKEAIVQAISCRIENVKKLAIGSKNLEQINVENTNNDKISGQYQNIESDGIKKAIALITSYYKKEFGITDTDSYFADLTEIPLAFTRLTSLEIPLQITADLKNFRIEHSFGGEIFQTEQYENLVQMCDERLENLSYSDLVKVPDELVKKTLSRLTEKDNVEDEDIYPSQNSGRER